MSVLSEDHGFAQQDDAPATRDTGQLLLVGLVVLALAASVIMMLTGNINLLKVALLAALWAAVFGIFLTYFYRNKLSEQKLEHENQIEQARLAFHAEQAARELELEQRITEKTNDATQETLDKIKDQLDNLRSQLEMLSGVSFEEPTMIRAEAHRIKEIKEISASDGMDYGSVDFDTTTSDPEMAEDYRESDDVSADSDQFNNARFGTYPTFTGSGSNATDMTDVFSHVPDPEPEFDPNAEWDESKHFSEFPVETATNNSNMEDSAVDGEPIPTDYDLPSYSSWEGSRYASENSEDAEVEEPTGSFPANTGANTGASGSDSGRSSGAHSSPDNSGASSSGYGADFSAARLQNIYGRSAASSQGAQGSQAAQGAQGSQTSGGHTSHRGSDSFAFGNSTSNAANANAGETDSRDTTNARSNDANTPNRATYPNFAMPSGSQENTDYSASTHDNRGSHRSGGHSANSNQSGFSYSNYGSGGYSSPDYSTPVADSNSDSAATVYDAPSSSGSSYASPNWSSTSPAVGDSATTDSTDSAGSQQDTGSWRQRVAAGSTPSEGGGRRRKQSEPEPEPQNHRGSHRRPEQEAEDTRHGRRRRDEGGGLSVADLLRRNDG
ncbi:DUF6779 domain-containing protein [Corynebacterium matruchotii]|uniref:DUF6779 domain-containing protein n=1 Tax=Corynebacterium matruchotii TaxID=43768 RepID=UPI0028EC9241|nr:DUF6779 domain-containing protein [Corynebacterium matruchotii]